MNDQNPDLRILSFNFRNAFMDRGSPHAWPLRRERCLELVRRGGFDFVGAQEVQWEPGNAETDQAGDLARGLPEYGMVGGTRDATAECGEGTPILYRRGRWEPDPDAQGQLWLSETPEVRASRSWDTDCPRILVWARFREKAGGAATGRTVLFANTHLDYRFEHTALLQAALCDRVLSERALPGEPVFLTGDFNMSERSWPVRYLLGEPLALPGAEATCPPLPLRDAWRAAHPDAPDERSYHGWGAATANRRIDYLLFAGPGLRVLDAAIEHAAPSGPFPSDHDPLVATFAWRRGFSTHGGGSKTSRSAGSLS